MGQIFIFEFVREWDAIEGNAAFRGGGGGVQVRLGGAAEMDPLGQRICNLISHETHVGVEPSNFHQCFDMEQFMRERHEPVVTMRFGLGALRGMSVHSLFKHGYDF